MTPVEVIETIKTMGVTLTLEGKSIRAIPTRAVTAEVRDLVAANRPAPLAALRPVDLRDMRPAGLAPGTLTVTCRDCPHLEPRPTERPDGWCRAYGVETWRCVPFDCDTSKAAFPQAAQVLTSPDPSAGMNADGAT